MRVIIAAVFFIGTLGVFAAVTAAIFIVQHLFAVTVLTAVMLLARRTKRRRPPAHRPPRYPALATPTRPASRGPQWPAHAMSSAAFPSRARRSLAPWRPAP